MNVWRFAVNWTTPASSTLTGPINVPVAAFTEACGGGTCVQQPGTSNQLDSLGDRLMYRFAYRRSTAASAAETAVVNHSVKTWGTKKSQVVGVRWYQLGNLTSGTPTVLQQSSYSPNSTSRWMGSIAFANRSTFFYTNEYLKASGSFNWSTWIGSFSFPGC